MKCSYCDLEMTMQVQHHLTVHHCPRCGITAISPYATKRLRFADGVTRRLCPITYEEFELMDGWTGTSDVEYESYKRFYGYVTLDEYTAEALEGAKVILL